MIEQFKKHIHHNFPELLNGPFLLACSGGLDSVSLVHLCHNANLDFSLAHCNFRLRGKASDADESLVKSLGKEKGKKVFVTHFDTLGYVNKNKVSVQMAARELRYSWFSKLRKEHGFSYIITAHHADDNLETFLINLSRGSGIEGLTGIPEKTDILRRPLLAFTRTELETYASITKMVWREDTSNADAKYLRNKIRLELVPILKQLHPSFLNNFTNTQTYLGQSKAIADAYLVEIKKRLFIKTDFGIKISIAELKKLHPLKAYLYGLFHSYGFQEWNNLINLLDAISGKRLDSFSHTLIKDRQYLLLTTSLKTDSLIDEYKITEETKKLVNPLHMTFEQVSKRDDNTSNVIYVQNNLLNYPLTLRKWKNGDYFYPVGLNKRKKLAKFFKDEKLNVLSKKDIWLLCSANEIVWVIGKRADHRFIVKDLNSDILRIEIKE